MIFPLKQSLRPLQKYFLRCGRCCYTAAAKRGPWRIAPGGRRTAGLYVAKTQYSLSDNARCWDAPRGFEITIRDLRVEAAARALFNRHAGDIMTMPGLPTVPAAEKIDVDGKGRRFACSEVDT